MKGINSKKKKLLCMIITDNAPYYSIKDTI